MRTCLGVPRYFIIIFVLWQITEFSFPIIFVVSSLCGDEILFILISFSDYLFNDNLISGQHFHGFAAH